MQGKAFANNYISLASIQVASYLIPLLSLPYLSKVLGAAGLGTLAFFLSLAQVITFIADYGFSLSATRDAAIANHDRKALSILLSTVTLIKAAILIPLAMFALISSATLSHDIASLTYCALSILIAMGNTLFPLWLYQGVEKLKSAAYIQLLSKLAGLLFIFILVRSQEDIHVALLINGLSSLLAAALALIHIRKSLHLSFLWPSRTYQRQMLRNGRHISISQLAINIYSSSMIMILGFILPTAVLGTYSIAEKILKATLGLMQPALQAVFPHASKIAHTQKDAVLAFSRKLLILSSAASISLSIALFTCSDALIAQLFGDEFHASAEVLKILSPLPFIITLSNIFGTQTMIPLRMDIQFTKTTTMACMLGIAITTTLSMIYGQHGSALAYLLVETFVTLCMLLQLMFHGVSPLQVRGHSQS